MDLENVTSTIETITSRQFDWTEYIVFALMLGLSAMIGVYFGFFKGGQNTVAEYLLGGKQMSIFPISMSLISSYISGITLLGVPSEVYSYGTQYMMCNLANVGVGVMTLCIFLPVFYKLQCLSLFEYLELRFDTKVRLVASFLYTVSLLTYIPIVIYGPALAFNQVSGINVHIVTPIICIVCIFYTSLGGLKAVVWSDAIQGAVMLCSVLAVMFLGISKVGGLSKVMSLAQEGDRLEFFNMDPDPTLRHSFWSATVGLVFFWTGTFATNPAAVQRFISLPTYRDAKLCVVFLILGTCLFVSLSAFIGIVMYAGYHDCDPLSVKHIERPDQILPFFVLDVAGHIKGLPGLFLAGIVCAALSTMSTGLNTVGGTIYEDFVEPHLTKKLDEKHASLLIKGFVILTGTICVILVAVIEKLGPILEMSASFGGMTAGATLGIFLMGMMVPFANTKGSICGALVSLGTMTWIMIGSRYVQVNGLIKHPTKVVSTHGCPQNLTSILPTLPTIEEDESSEVFVLYKVSFFYYSLMGCVIVIVVGLIVSYFTEEGNKKPHNPDLFCSFVHRFLPDTSLSRTDTAQTEIKEKTVPLLNHKMNNNNHVA